MPVWKRAVTASHKIPTDQVDADSNSNSGGEGNEDVAVAADAEPGTDSGGEGDEGVPEIVVQAQARAEKKKRTGKSGLPDLVLYYDALQYHQAVIAELKTYWAYTTKQLQDVFSILVLTNNNRGIQSLGYLEDNNLTVIQGPDGGYFDWRQNNVGACILKQVLLVTYGRC